MGPKTCKVCDDAQSKYKCPTCLIPYCSLLCFKKHKAPTIHHERTYYVDKSSEVLEQLQLESIASSGEIRDALKDEELRKLICKIDGSADADNELDKAMEVEAFRIFTEKIFSTICP